MTAAEAGILVDVAFAVRDTLSQVDPQDTYGALVPGMIAGVQRGAELLLGVDEESAWRIAFACAQDVLLDDD